MKDDFHRGVWVEPPKNKKGCTTKMSVDGETVYLRTGEYEDTSLAEISIQVGLDEKDSDVNKWLRDISSSVSIGLQCGVPLKQYVNEYVNLDKEPTLTVEGHRSITKAHSILDAVFRDLAITYLRAEVTPVEEETASVHQLHEDTNVVTLYPNKS